VVVASALLGVALASDHHFFAVATGTGGLHSTPAAVWLGWVMALNALVLALNLVPAFPLDGGQIAHALVWWRTGDRNLATRLTGRIGQGFALVVGAGALFLLAAPRTRLAGIYALVLALFLYQGAGAAVAQGVLGQRMQQLTVGDIMDREPVTIPAQATLLDAQEQFLGRYRWPWFAVVDPAQHFLGVVLAQKIEEEIAAGRPALPVVEALEQDVAGARIDEREPLESLLRSEALARLGGVVAVDREGTLRGVVTLAQVRRALRLAPGS
jgi:CBS domain-containing protein